MLLFGSLVCLGLGGLSVLCFRLPTWAYRACRARDFGLIRLIRLRARAYGVLGIGLTGFRSLRF